MGRGRGARQAGDLVHVGCIFIPRPAERGSARPDAASGGGAGAGGRRAVRGNAHPARRQGAGGASARTGPTRPGTPIRLLSQHLAVP
eukprot:5194332-Prymnesium_polylepis.1